jgi:hypothetical protein
MDDIDPDFWCGFDEDEDWVIGDERPVRRQRPTQAAVAVDSPIPSRGPADRADAPASNARKSFDNALGIDPSPTGSMPNSPSNSIIWYTTILNPTQMEMIG